MASIEITEKIKNCNHNQLAMALWLRMAGLKKSTHTGGRQTLSVYRLHFYASIISILYLLSFFLMQFLLLFWLFVLLIIVSQTGFTLRATRKCSLIPLYTY